VALPLPSPSELQETGEAVRQALREIRDMSPVMVEVTGDLCYTPAARAVGALLDDPTKRFLVYLALAEYLASALDGCPLDIEKWQPLQRLRYPQKVASFKS
jgi:hypothetical protein